MSRPLRIECPGAVYHITSRGNARQSIFLNDSDRERFLTILASTIKRFNWLCHAYCLIDNHYHLIIETPEGNISRGMRQLNGVYTQYFNRRHKTVGHIFQGRFKAIMVDKESYLLSLCRYVVLNPVRIGVVKGPSQWKWSSYRPTIGEVKRPPFLTVDWVLSQFGNNTSEAVVSYKRFVREGMKEDTPWKEVKGQIFLGTDDFTSQFKGLLKGKERIKEIPRGQRYATRLSLEKLLHKRNQGISDEAIYEAYISYGYALKDIAEYVGVHYTTVSRTIKRVEERDKKK
jgi:putative transposase